MTVTESLVAFSTSAPYAAPARVPVLVATLVDTVGVALPGVAELPALQRWDAADPAPGGATVWGRGTASTSRAALLNGTAAHALDFDDAVPASPLHPSTVLWPAVLAVAEVRGSTWTDALAAVDVGNAVVRAVTEALPGDAHYGRGWHTTSTVGRIAAVCALARLLHLDATTTRHALGIVASTAAGSRASFGTATKPLHAGLAAHDAVVAVAMAEAGMDAHPAQLDSPLGFLALYGEPADRTAFAARLAHRAAAWPQDWSLKRYPSCYGTHYALDAVLALAPSVSGAVQRVDVRVHPGSLRPLIARRPTTGAEGRFSLEYTVASALADGRLGLDAFTDLALHRETVVALMDRVHVRGEGEPADLPEVVGLPYAHVRVVTAGATHERLVTVTHGDARDPLSAAEVDGKALACAAAAGWDELESREVVARLRTAPAGGTVDLSALRRTDGQEGRR